MAILSSNLIFKVLSHTQWWRVLQRFLRLQMRGLTHFWLRTEYRNCVRHRRRLQRRATLRFLLERPPWPRRNKSIERNLEIENGIFTKRLNTLIFFGGKSNEQKYWNKHFEIFTNRKNRRDDISYSDHCHSCRWLWQRWSRSPTSGYFRYPLQWWATRNPISFLDQATRKTTFLNSSPTWRNLHLRTKYNLFVHFQ
jgi:hypothetical protein